MFEILFTQPSKIKSNSFPPFLFDCLLFNLDYILNSRLGYKTESYEKNVMLRGTQHSLGTQFVSLTSSLGMKEMVWP